MVILKKNKISYVNGKRLEADSIFSYIIVLFLAFISPILALIYSCLGIICAGKNLKPYILGIALAIGGFSVAFVPGTTSDLVRYFEMLDHCYNKDFAYVNTYFHDGLYVKNLMFWMISQTGCYGLLSGITTGTVYYIAMYITVQTAQKYNSIKLAKILVLFQIAVLPYVSIANNIRNIFSFAIIAVAAFRDICLKKRGLITWILYIAPCFFHTAAVVVLLIRFVAPFCRRFIWLIILMAILIVPAINILYLNVNSIPVDVLQRLIIKAHAYLSDSTTSWGIEVAASSWERTVKAAFMILMSVYAVIIVHYFLKRHKAKTYQSDKYIGFIFLLVLLSMLCGVIFTTPAYWRFSAVVNVTIGAMIIPITKTFSRKGKKYLYACLGMIAIACTLLQLYRLPYMVDIITWIANSSYSGGLYVLTQILF